jgi:hypothetical protein
LYSHEEIGECDIKEKPPVWRDQNREDYPEEVGVELDIII